MGVLAKLELPVQEDRIDEMKSFLAEIFPETRTYPGFQAIDAYQSQDDPTHFVLIEVWGAREDHQKYLAWREETGVLGKIVSMLSGPPDIKYFDRIDA